MWNPLPAFKGTSVAISLWQAGARLLEALGAEEQALRLVNRAVKVAPQKSELHLHATRLCLKRGKVDQAILHWRKAAGEQGRTSLLYWLRRTAGRGQSVQRLLRNNHRVEEVPVQENGQNRANTVKPKSSRFFQLFNDRPPTLSLNDVGVQLLEMGRVEEALAVFRQELAAKGISPTLCFNLGLAFSKLGHHREALEYYERAQAGGLNSVELLNNKGYSLSFLRQDEEAVACYELAKEMSPGDGVILANLASCYHRLELYHQALNCYENALRCLPADPVIYNNYALCLEDVGRSEEALDCYERALALAPRSKNILLNKAACLQKLGRYREALEICDGIIAREPDCPETWGLKGNLCKEMGDSREAVRCYGRALGVLIRNRESQIPS